MNPLIRFVELENRVIVASYRNLMTRAKVQLVDHTSGTTLDDPVITIASRLPAGWLRINLPESVGPGVYFLKALNANGDYLTRSSAFQIG